MQHMRHDRRPSLGELALSALSTGTVAGLVTQAALALLAEREGKGALQPINATSHWLHGPRAGRRRGADWEHTGVGFATNHAAAVFWAAPFEWWLARKPWRSAGEMLGGAAAVSAIAAAVDYGIVPRRARPGWEHAVSAPSVAAGFVMMALGLAAGALATQAVRRG